MPEIVIRPVQPEDLEGYFDVRALTYNSGNPVPDEKREFKYSRGHVAMVDGEVSAGFTLYDFTCTRGPALLKCAGLASLAVYPHRRRSGIGSAIMTWLPRHLREVGIPLCNLWAYRDTFYRRFGWEVVGRPVKITCPILRLPKTSSGLEIRRLRPEDWRELDPCFTAFAHARSGLSLRTEPLWHRVLAENRQLTIYAAGRPVESFVVVSHNTAFWTTDHMSDVAWSTRRGHDALIEIFAGLGINKTAFSWDEPSDSPFCAQYLDQGVQMEITDKIMYRVCDVPGALRMLRPESAGAFAIRVSDPVVPANEGPWQVEFDQTVVRVSPAPEAELTIGIHGFTQAFLGEPSLGDLARIGLVDGTASAIRQASSLLTPLPVMCAEGF